MTLILVALLLERKPAMRRAMILAALALCTPAWGATVSAGSFNIRSAQDVLGCADVRAFGAVGDGVHDDTAAIQAAINFGSGRPVCLPPGIFKITSTVTLGYFTYLSGAGGSSSGTRTNTDAPTIIDARSITNATALAGTGNSTGIRLSGFVLWGPNGNANSIGINPGSFSRDFLFSDVGVVGFRYGFYLYYTQHGTLLNCATQLQIWSGQTAAGLYSIASQALQILAGDFANASGYNIWLSSNGADLTRDVQIISPLIDEAFSSGSVLPAPIFIDGADNVVIQGRRLYYGHGGYGIRLGNGTTNPSNVTIRDLRIMRFAASVPPLAGIELRGSGHILDNVTVNVDPDGGTTALSDLASGTKMFRVTGITAGTVTTYIALQDPAMPTAYPGTGSKQVWADPTNATTNVLRFAP